MRADRVMSVQHEIHDEERDDADPCIGGPLDDAAWRNVGLVHLEMLDDDRAYLGLHEHGTGRFVQVEIVGSGLTMRVSHDDVSSGLVTHADYDHCAHCRDLGFDAPPSESHVGPCIEPDCPARKPTRHAVPGEYGPRS